MKREVYCDTYLNTFDGEKKRRRKILGFGIGDVDLSDGKDVLARRWAMYRVNARDMIGISI